MVLDLGPADAPQFRAAFPETPLVWIGGVAPPIPSLADLRQAGFALSCYPLQGNAPLATGLAALWGGLARDGTSVPPAGTHSTPTCYNAHLSTTNPLSQIT